MAETSEPRPRRCRTRSGHRHRTRSASGGECSWPHCFWRDQLIRLYRVLRKIHAKNPFDGEGAFRFGGRWSSSAVRLAYASEHQSLAMLEYFVHMDADDSPPDLALANAEVPDDVLSEHTDVEDLPSNWRENPAPPPL